jgi:flagellar protein FliL
VAKEKKKEEKVEAGEPAKKKGGGLVMQIVVLLVMCALAGGAGWGMSGFMSAPPSSESEAEHAPAEGTAADHAAASADKDAHGAPAADGHGEAKDGETPSLMGSAQLLEPIVTNIASPQDVWVRLEMALVAEGPLEERLVQTVREDLFAYVRTLRLSQLEGPSGFISLKADLLDRAKIRSEDKVSAVLIKTLLFE